MFFLLISLKECLTLDKFVTQISDFLEKINRKYLVYTNGENHVLVVSFLPNSFYILEEYISENYISKKYLVDEYFSGNYLDEAVLHMFVYYRSIPEASNPDFLSDWLNLEEEIWVEDISVVELLKYLKERTFKEIRKKFIRTCSNTYSEDYFISLVNGFILTTLRQLSYHRITDHLKDHLKDHPKDHLKDHLGDHLGDHLDQTKNPIKNLKEYETKYLGVNIQKEDLVETQLGEVKVLMRMLKFVARLRGYLIYPYLKEIKCTLLEVESQIRSLSEKNCNLIISEMSKYRVEELIGSHNLRSRTFSENKITSVLYENYVSKYVSVMDGKNFFLWIFEDGLWKESSLSVIWKDLSTTFVDFLEDLKVQKLEDIIQYLGSVGARERILKDLVQRLQDDQFLNKLNTNTHLIGMKDGVYDINLGKLRKSLPHDYISMSTHICCSSVDIKEEKKKKVKKEIEENKKERQRKELMKILSTIFPNKDLLHYFIRSCAMFLEGKNKNKLVYIWWGKGNNGKSMIEKLLIQTLGDYSTVATTSLITSKRANAENATPQLVNLEGKLVVFLQEPNPTEVIRIGTVKELSGGDAITARPLFKSPRTFIPKFKLVLISNTIMDIPHVDVAFKNRLIVIPFLSTFYPKGIYEKKKKEEKELRQKERGKREKEKEEEIKRNKMMGKEEVGKEEKKIEEEKEKTKKGKIEKEIKIENKKHYFLMDTNINKNIGNYSKIFLEILLEEYEKIKNTDLTLEVPQIVKEYTRRYLEWNNSTLNFIKNGGVVRDKNSEIPIKYLYQEYKLWVTNHLSKKPLDYISFKDEIRSHGYVILNNLVQGIYFRRED